MSEKPTDQITPEERFALQMLFRAMEPIGKEVCKHVDALEAVKRKATGVGFFTSFRLPVPVPINGRHHWDWNFEHRRLSHGGSFMCWLDDSGVLELEAVSHNGTWPSYFDSKEFKGIG